MLIKWILANAVFQIAFNQLIAVDKDQALISSYLVEFWWWSLWQPDADPGHVYSNCSRLIHGSLKGRGSPVSGGHWSHHTRESANIFLDSSFQSELSCQWIRYCRIHWASSDPYLPGSRVS